LSRDSTPPYVQVVLDEPIHALARDAFILRHPSGQKTLAGGIVLDPQPPIRGRRKPGASRCSLRSISATPRARWRTCCRSLPTDRPRPVHAGWNLGADEVERLWQNSGLARFEGRGYDATRWRHGRDAIVNEVSRVHATHPDSFGPSAAQLLRSDVLPAGRQFRRALLESLIKDRELVREGGQVRRPTHEIELSATELVLWRRISPLLGPGRRPMTVHDIAKQEKLDYKVVNHVVERAARAGHVVKIAVGRFLHKSAILQLAAEAEALAASSREGSFDAASFRDRSGLGRNVSIELLEYFDRIGFTQRFGDLRRVNKPAASVVSAERL
jgi:selenocysteine-specific elongation factor